MSQKLSASTQEFFTQSQETQNSQTSDQTEEKCNLELIYEDELSDEDLIASQTSVIVISSDEEENESTDTSSEN